MANRFSDHQKDFQISNSFSNYSLSTRLNLFESETEDSVKTIVEQFVKQKLNEARKEGEKRVLQNIAREVKKWTDDYLILINKIVEILSETAKENLAKGDFKIIEARTNFHFDTRAINILFIIDAGLKDEIEFCGLISETKKSVFQEDNFLAEIFYINKRNAEIDLDSVYSDLPYYRKNLS